MSTTCAVCNGDVYETEPGIWVHGGYVGRACIVGYVRPVAEIRNSFTGKTTPVTGE